MTTAPASLDGVGDVDLVEPTSPSLDSIAQAAEVVAALESRVKDRITLSNGIVLKLKPVPPLAIREAAISTPPPKPPVMIMADKGREEENPNDPDYIEAVRRWNRDQTARVSDTIMLLGTGIEELPDYIEPVESDAWIEQLDALGITVDGENKYKRYLSWLRLYAIVAEADITKIMRNVTGLSGVTEEEVQHAAAAFRRSS